MSEESLLPKEGPIHSYFRWAHDGDFDLESSSGRRQACRVRAWHGTYNAVLGGLLATNAWSMSEACEAAEKQATQSHGPIGQYHVRQWASGSYDCSAIGNLYP